ncbi:MAG: hypothetical protein AB8B79_16690 [Granulosicoccus sp.]
MKRLRGPAEFFRRRPAPTRPFIRSEFRGGRPEAADTRTGHGRQVSFIVKARTTVSASAQWMRQRIDSIKGKEI